MCTKRISCEQLEKVVGRRCFVTRQRFGIPLLLADDGSAERSLVVYTTGQHFSVDEEGNLVSRNPLGFEQNSEIIKRMNLGLSEDAGILWVNLSKKASKALDGKSIAVVDLDTTKIDELLSQNFDFAAMWGVISVLRHRVTHWLVRQPLASAKHLNLNAIQRKADGCWQTEKELYFIVTAGFINTVEDFADDLSPEEYEEKLTELYKQNLDEFLESYAALEKISRKEEAQRHRRQLDLPGMRETAYDFVQQYEQLMQDESFCFYLQKREETTFDVEFDAEQDRLSFAGKCCDLSKDVLDECKALLEQLQQKVTDFKNRSRKVEGFRMILEDVTRAITITDWYGKLEQRVARRPAVFRTVEVELMEEYAYIVVLRGDKEKSRLRFSYDEVAKFHNQLIKLGLVSNASKLENDARTEKSHGWFLNAMMLSDDDCDESYAET